MDVDKNYCYKTENVNSNTLEQWQGLTAFLFRHSCLLRSTVLSCMGFVSTHVACNHLAMPFPRKLLPVPDLKQSRGCDSRRLKIRNNLHSTMCLTWCQKGLYWEWFLSSCSCAGFENCSENCHHQEAFVSKNFTMSPAQQSGAASQNCDHTLAFMSARIQWEQGCYALPKYLLVMPSLLFQKAVQHLHRSSFWHSSCASLQYHLWSP